MTVENEQDETADITEMIDIENSGAKIAKMPTGRNQTAQVQSQQAVML